MLLGGLPEREKQKLAVEMKLNLGVFSASVRSEGTVGPMEHRVPRLEAVVKHLTKTEWVGTIQSPGTYIADTAVFSHGVYQSSVSQLPPAAMFASESSDHCFLMMGSPHHIVGNQEEYDMATSPSYVIQEILKAIETEDAEVAGGKQVPALIQRVQMALKWTTRLEGLQQRLEFFAKKLGQGASQNTDGTPVQVTLATPIYVAMAD